MIYIIRHGQCTLNAERVLRCKNKKSDLTVIGREQARKAGIWLADKNIGAIYSSAFDRTQQTAAYINESLGLPAPIIEDGLGELDCGDAMEDKPYADVLDDYMGVMFSWIKGDRDVQFPGGEDGHTAVKRFTDVLRRVDSAQNPVLVSHGGITRIGLPTICSNPEIFKKERVLHNTGIVILQPDATIPGKFICTAWDVIEHLDREELHT